VYRVWIDYEDGTHREQVVPDSNTADALKAEWQAAGAWHDSGYELLNVTPAQ
jgi:hypothetical protein